jgi:phosphate starvation-inducible PhoH-like protein
MSKYKAKKEESNSIKLEALSENQAQYIKSINDNVVSIGLGFAGSGKTYIAATLAAEFKITVGHSKIVLCRPNVSDSRSIGSLPGDEAEKMAPWITPYAEVLRSHLGDKFECDYRKGRIQVVPFEFMQGRTFDNSFVILDEAQHTSPKEMEMFLKRIGRGSKVVVCGDINQARLGEKSGLKHLIKMQSDWRFRDLRKIIGLTVFDNPDDIVRSDFCREITVAFDRYNELTNQ